MAKETIVQIAASGSEGSSTIFALLEGGRIIYMTLDADNQSPDVWRALDWPDPELNIVDSDGNLFVVKSGE